MCPQIYAFNMFHDIMAKQEISAILIYLAAMRLLHNHDVAKRFFIKRNSNSGFLSCPIIDKAFRNSLD